MRVLFASLLALLLAAPAQAVAVKITLLASRVQGGSPASARLLLAAAAPAGGVQVQLASSNGQVTFADPVTQAAISSVQIAAGKTARDVAIRSVPVAAAIGVQLTAATTDSKSTTTLTLLPPAVQALQAVAARPVGGDALELQVTLTGIAPARGLPLTVTSKSLPIASGSSVTFPAGTSAGRVRVPTQPVAAVTAGEIAAGTSAGAASARVTLYPPAITALTLTPPSVAGAARVSATATASHPAPAGGLPVAVQRAAPSPLVAITAPATVVIPAGRSSAVLALEVRAADAAAASEVFVARTASGESRATLAVVPLRVTGIGVEPAQARGGDSVTITVARNGVASDPATSSVNLYAGLQPDLSNYGWLATAYPQSNHLPRPLAVSMGAATTATITVPTALVAEPTAVRVATSLEISATPGPYDWVTLLPYQVVNVELRRRINGVTQPELLTDTVGSGQEVEISAYLEATPVANLNSSSGPPIKVTGPDRDWNTVTRTQVGTLGSPLVRFTWLVPARTEGGNIGWWVGAVHRGLWTSPVTYTLAPSAANVRAGQQVSLSLQVNALPESVGAGVLPCPLESSNPSIVSVPATVDLGSGRNSMTFVLTPRPVSVPTVVQIKAGGTAGNFATGSVVTLTVAP